MEVSITTMSQNGQIVIPSEVRKDAAIKPSAKFLVFNDGGDILLKQITKEELIRNLQLIERIARSEKQIASGKYVKADTKMSVSEVHDKLMKS